MPVADTPATVISVYGHQRANEAWVIGRLLRDFEHRAKSQITQTELDPRLAGSFFRYLPSKLASWPVLKKLGQPKAGSVEPSWEALRITVFEVDPTYAPGYLIRDWVFYLGFVVIFIQIGIAVTPWALSGNHMPLVVTVGGTALCLLTSALPQWRQEKFAHCKSSGSTTSITRGNGSRHVMLILGKEHGYYHGLDLEIMAARNPVAITSPLTRIGTTILAIFSVVLLITVSGLRKDTWC